MTTSTPPARPIHTADYDALVDELAYTYDGVFSRSSIAAAVDSARTRLRDIRDDLQARVSALNL